MNFLVLALIGLEEEMNEADLFEKVGIGAKVSIYFSSFWSMEYALLKEGREGIIRVLLLQVE